MIGRRHGGPRPDRPPSVAVRGWRVDAVEDLREGMPGLWLTDAPAEHHGDGACC